MSDSKLFLDSPLEVKAEGGGTAGEFSGYASVFDVVDSHRDVVKKGSFLKSLEAHETKGSFPAMLAQHDPSREIGEWLEMREDERGLFVKGRLWIDGERPDADAMKMHRSMKKKRGRPGLSIGYRPKGFEIDRDAQRRNLTEVDLLEVSVLSFGPSNPETFVTDAKASELDIRGLERALREAGLSKKEAVTAVSVFRAHLPGDPGDGNDLSPRDASAQVEALLSDLRSLREKTFTRS